MVEKDECSLSDLESPRVGKAETAPRLIIAMEVNESIVTDPVLTRSEVQKSLALFTSQIAPDRPETHHSEFFDSLTSQYPTCLALYMQALRELGSICAEIVFYRPSTGWLDIEFPCYSKRMHFNGTKFDSYS
jgi:hypothetical protein